MGFFRSRRIDEWRSSCELLQRIANDGDRVQIVHYACESFQSAAGGVPRIITIAVRDYGKAQTVTFSIHTEAAIKGVDLRTANKKDLDELEKSVINTFVSYAKAHRDNRWVHWAMRDSHYGFEAIRNRAKALGATKLNLDNDKRYDLHFILGKAYTQKFIASRGNGALLNLAAYNCSSIEGALTGQQEADAYAQGKYVELHRSTIKKVELIAKILHRWDKHGLKMDVGPIAKYGLTVPGMVEIVRNNWLLTTGWSLVCFVGGVLSQHKVETFAKWVQSLFTT